MTLSAYQVACLSVVGIVALSMATIWLVAIAVIAIANWVETKIQRHSHDPR